MKFIQITFYYIKCNENQINFILTINKKKVKSRHYFFLQKIKSIEGTRNEMKTKKYLSYFGVLLSWKCSFWINLKRIINVIFNLIKYLSNKTYCFFVEYVLLFFENFFNTIWIRISYKSETSEKKKCLF